MARITNPKNLRAGAVAAGGIGLGAMAQRLGTVPTMPPRPMQQMPQVIAPQTPGVMPNIVSPMPRMIRPPMQQLPRLIPPVRPTPPQKAIPQPMPRELGPMRRKVPAKPQKPVPSPDIMRSKIYEMLSRNKTLIGKK